MYLKSIFLHLIHFNCFKQLKTLYLAQTCKRKHKDRIFTIKYQPILNQRLTFMFEGNSNFQGLLNWILQTLHHYYRKKHKKIKDSQFIEQNVIIFFCPSLCLLQQVLPFTSSMAEFFSSWTQYSSKWCKF